MAVVADKEDRAALGKVDLHSDEAFGVARQVMECNALAEVQAALVERLPVPGRVLASNL